MQTGWDFRNNMMEAKEKNGITENFDDIVCVHNEFCGGCSFQNISYAEQLEIKENEILTLIDKKKLSVNLIEKIEPSPIKFRYRNKMEYTFGDLVKDGEMTLGMHKKGFHMSIVTVDQCQLVHEDYNKVLKAVLEFVREKGYRKYNKKTHTGFLRHLIVRTGYNTGEMLVNLVVSSQDSLDESEFKEMIMSLELLHKVVGIMVTVNDDKADAVQKNGVKVIYGRDYYIEKLLGLQFKVSIFSFFQTNIAAIERLYRQAMGLIDDLSGKVVFDLFCGTGTISQSMAKSAKQVVGVEIVKEAVLAAEENVKLNNIDNCKFIEGDVFEVLDMIEEKPDVIVLDPPRMVIEAKALDKILKYEVDEIVYISCNPKTLVENLYYMEYYGYTVEYLKGFDNFPNTKHTECICKLKRIKNI